MLGKVLRRLKRTERLHPEAGVTLVEMMVVIVIIGLVTAIVVINVLPSTDVARTEKARADISTLTQALELYRLQEARYPTMEEGLEALLPQTDAQAGAQTRQGYIRSLPNDPWNRPYLYVTPGEHGEVDIYTLGADGQEGGENANADIGSWQS